MATQLKNLCIGPSVGLLSAMFVASLSTSTGCHSVQNGWMDPTVLGGFKQTGSPMEIRTALSLDDTPMGIPGATFPIPDDLIATSVEHLIQSGDTLAIEIHELRLPDIPFQSQSVVSATGYVNLPVVGRIQANGLTVPGFQELLVQTLRDRNILMGAQVTVNPLFLQSATYSIFGIGVSAANDAPLRAGTFPIGRPDLTVLEAINQVGGLSEFVTDIFIFRYGDHGRSRPVSSKDVDAVQAHDALSETALLHDRGDAPAKFNNDRDELIASIEQPQRQDPPVEDRSVELEMDDALKPTPFLYVNGEFVANPEYDTSSETAVPVLPPGALDTATPAASWARIAGDSQFRVIRIPADVLRNGDPSVNVVVHAGDVIRIVSGEIGVYYVMGQVLRVGAFAFNAEQITLKAAIATAGGLSSLAWPDRCTVYRRVGAREQMIQVDLDRIFAGKDADFFVKRGDIINVGTHPFAPFLQVIRGLTIPNPVSNIGYSFTYARNFADIDSFAAQTNPRSARRFDNRFDGRLQGVFDAAIPPLFPGP